MTQRLAGQVALVTGAAGGIGGAIAARFADEGCRIIALDPPRGFAAESTAAVVLYVMAIGLHAPVSTTHTMTSAVMGAGATKRFSAVRWGVARGILVAWVLTLPAAAAVSALSYVILSHVIPQ